MGFTTVENNMSNNNKQQPHQQQQQQHNNNNMPVEIINNKQQESEITSAVNAAKEYLKQRDASRVVDDDDDDETTDEYDVNNMSSSYVDEDDDDDASTFHNGYSSQSHNDDDDENDSRPSSSRRNSRHSDNSSRHSDNDHDHDKHFPENNQVLDDNYDPEVDDIDWNQIESSEVLSNINHLVLQAYQHEYSLSSSGDEDNGQHKYHYQQISIHDIDIHNSDMIQPETSMYELVFAWKTLIDLLNEKAIFLEYINHIEDAFELTGNCCIDEPKKSTRKKKQYDDDGDDDDDDDDDSNGIDSNDDEDDDDGLITRYDVDMRRKMLTLVVLLQRCVENYNLDKSITCRFLTILEIMLSYGFNWKPSEHVIRLWIRLMQRIPNDVIPINFRRKAYRVLVSLSWVPSSKGLMEACSFEHMIRPIDYNKNDIQTSIRSHMERIKNGPLPRYDCVNQLLDRLKDETDVCVAITSSCDGMGKTTIAGQVASHPSIQRVFYVLWLSVTSSSIDEMMTYEKYTMYLNELYSQLPSTKKNNKSKKKSSNIITWPKYIQRFEEISIRKLREQDCIIEAKERMGDILLKQDRNILLVLDDVSDPNVIECFRFFDRQSIIVTTSKPELLLNVEEKYNNIVDWSVQLTSMSNEEGIELFLSEANLPMNHIIGSTKEILYIIQKTKCHPLYIRTIARWYQMKSEKLNNFIQAIDEILYELNSLEDNNSINNSNNNINYNNIGDYNPDHINYKNTNIKRPDQLLFDVLQLMMKQPNKPDEKHLIRMSPIFVLCFAIMVVVFDDHCPLDSVLLLWDQILKSEPVAIEELKRIASDNNKKDNADTDDDEEAVMTDNEIRKYGRHIAERLSHIGLISVVEVNGSPWVHVHHQLYRQFALIMARQMTKLKDNYDDAVAGWNHAFVTAYFRKRIQCDKKDFDDNSWAYSIEKLPTHMFKGKMIPTAIAVLSDEVFFEARIEAMGWDRGIEQHVRDCICLQQEMIKNNIRTEINDTDNNNDTNEPIPASTVFSRCAEMIKILADELDLPDDEITIWECRALYRLGFALTEIGYYVDAIEHFENAQQLSPRSRSLKASILYSAGWALLANNEPGKAKKKINASRKIMDQGSDLHELYKEMLLVYAESLVATCDYREASSFYEVIVENMRSDKEDNPIEFGTALYRKGRLDYVIGDLELAKKTLDECIKWKIEICETSESLAYAHALYGDIYIQLDKQIDAKKCYEASIQILKQLNCDMQKLECQVTTAKLLFLRNEFDGSRQLFDDIVKKIQDYPIMVLDQSAYDLRMISRIYCSSGDTVTSIAMLEECLMLTKNRPFSLERSWVYMELGHCLIEESKVKEGLTCYEEALGIQITKLGESPQIIETSKLIGSVHFSLGDYEASLSIFLKVHEILLRVSPDNIDKIAEILFLIGDTYESQASYKEAEETYENCLEVLLEGRAEEHADIGKVNHRIGEAALKRNELDGALIHFTEALRIRKMNFDERVVAETLQSLGIVYRKQNELSSAKKWFLEALEIRKNLHIGRESCETVLELAHVYRLQLDYSNASKLLTKGLELVDETDVFNSNVNITFGHLKLSQGDFAASEDYYKIALDIREENYGKDHRLTGNVYRSLGIVYYVQEKSDVAYTNLNEYIRISDLYGEDCWETVDYVVALIMIGDIHFAENQLVDAAVNWTHAKELFDDTELIQVSLPDLESMINRRLGDDGSIRDEISIQLLTEEEIAIIQNIHFIDD